MGNRDPGFLGGPEALEPISLVETARLADQLKRLLLAALDAASGLERVDHASADAVEARVALAVCARSLAELSFAAEALFPTTVPPLAFEPAAVGALPAGLPIAERAGFLLEQVIAPVEEIRATVRARARRYQDQNLASFLDDAGGVISECRELLKPVTKI